MEKFIQALVIVITAPVVLPVWYAMWISGVMNSFIARNQIVIAYLELITETYGYTITIGTGKELGLGTGVLGECGKGHIKIRHAYRLKTLVDTFYHEVRHAQQATDSLLVPKYENSMLSRWKGVVSYWDCWHERDARKYARRATKCFLNSMKRR